MISGATAIAVVPMSELGTELVARWSEAQLADPRTDSPFYRPEYFQLLDDAMRTDRGAGRIEVGVIPDAEDDRFAFLPFQRESRWRAGPPGRSLTDYQGLVGHAARASVVDLLRVAGVDEWRFDHVPVTQTELEPWFGPREPSPLIDLRDGYEAWAVKRRLIAELEYKRRRLARDMGPVRFEPTVCDPAVLARLAGWKSAQFQRTGKRDLFAVPWIRTVAEQLLTVTGAQFGGRLSALYAGDDLVAAHLGMTSGQIWHWWISAYDHNWSRRSPGAILLLEMVRSASVQGTPVIDLGKGTQLYKTRFANAELMLTAGLVRRHGLLIDLRRVVRERRGALRRRKPARLPTSGEPVNHEARRALGWPAAVR